MIEFQPNTLTQYTHPTTQMIRSVLPLAAFAFVSPVIRRYFIDAYSTVDAAIRLHSTIAFTLTGVLVFSSFLAIQLTAPRR